MLDRNISQQCIPFLTHRLHSRHGGGDSEEYNCLLRAVVMDIWPDFDHPSFLH